MTIKQIIEIENENLPNFKPVEEVMNKLVPHVTAENIPKRNGEILIFSGSGGSGKTSLLLNFFLNKEMYKYNFSKVYLIVPESSFMSVKDHPFKEHDKIYHEISDGLIMGIYNELSKLKETLLKKKKKPRYSCVIIDDFADKLKDKEIVRALNYVLPKARHINCMFIFCLQSYYYFPKILRKQLTYCILFKSKNIEEFESVAKEIMNMKKDDALKLFNYVYDEPYNHLDINTIDNSYYKNFNKLELKN